MRIDVVKVACFLETNNETDLVTIGLRLTIDFDLGKTTFLSLSFFIFEVENNTDCGNYIIWVVVKNKFVNTV